MTDRKRICRGFSPQQRQELLAEYHASELTQPEFALTHGLVLSTFKGWLGDERRARRNGSPTKALPPLRELKLSEMLGAPAWAAEVILPQGITVRLGAQASQVWMRELLQSLRAAC